MRPERVAATRTVPEQIADSVGAEIINGTIRGGERLLEQDLALRFGVSRGPVREAIRELERRGLVEFFPRRGAYVVSLTLDTIAEVFNIRAALMGLAARSMAAFRSEKSIAELEEAVDEVERLAALPATSPTVFIAASNRVARTIIKNCGNLQLEKILREQVRHSLWGMIWTREPSEFGEKKWQLELCASWREVLHHIREGNGGAAESAQRRIHYRHRDHALSVLGRLPQYGATIDTRRLLYED